MGFFKTKKKAKSKLMYDEFQNYMLSDKSPFSVQEAYKTVRTNIMFTLPGGGCKTIVVTSGLQGESKSTTAINIGIAFAQNNAKVVLIDCDLRLPTVGVKLGIPNAPGISNLLVGLASAKEVVHRLPCGLDIITAGDIPPNPTELLGSAQMEKVIAALGKVYDYIILDTPPVGTVSDAVILSKIASGVLVVARQNVAEQGSVDNTVQKLEFANAKILGFVFTGVKDEKHASYKKYGYGYGYGYADSSRKKQ